MTEILIQGPQKLDGSVKISGAKNAALPIIAAAVLTRETVTLHNVPKLTDTLVMVEILESLGATVSWSVDALEIKCEALNGFCVGRELAEKLRASVLFCGSLIGRFKRASVALPGGCAIGSRPIDEHIKGFRALGLEVDTRTENLELDGQPAGALFRFGVPSVTGTANVLLAAVLGSGRSIFENVAKEPEIVDLCELLRAMGAQIEGVGTSRLVVDGVDELRGCTHEVVQDRIEAGTFLLGALITNGKVTIADFDYGANQSLLQYLGDTGAEICSHERSITVSRGTDMTPVDVVTEPHPGFPTDLQAQAMVLNLVLVGQSSITETIFENRFMHATELMRMGASVEIDGPVALLEGGKPLSGALVSATDLRASIALILAGLAADGETRVSQLHHLYRGYENPVGKFKQLGVTLQLVAEI